MASGLRLGGPAVDFVPTLETLSQDAMLEILTFLPGTDVARCASVSRAMREAVDDKQLWRSLFWSEFQTVFASRLSLRIRDPRSVYKERVQQRTTRIRERTTARVAYQARLAAVPAQKRVRKCIDCWQLGVTVGCFFVCVLLFLIFLGSAIDSPADWTWAEVFTPTYVLAGILASSICLGCVAKACDRHSAPGGWWANAYDSYEHQSPAKVLINEILGSHPQGYTACACIGLAWLAVPVVLTLKLQGDIDCNWGTAMTPIWLAFLLTCCCVPLGSRDMSGGDSVGFMGAFTMGTCTLWVPLILLAIRLDGADVPAHMILMPWWIILGMYALAAVFGCVIVTFMMLREGTRTEVLPMWGACLMTVLGMGPLIAFSVLVSLKDADAVDASWAEVFTPLWVFASYLVLVGLGVCSAALNDSCRRGYHTITVPRPDAV